MGEDERPPSLEELGERLRAAREHRGADRQHNDTESGGGPGFSGVGWAFRIGVELVSALIVGVGIGLGLDWWLGTGPWFLVLFFLLGSAAAILNVYRTAVGYGLAAGYRKPDEEREEEQGKNTGDAGDGDSKGGSASTEGGKAGEVQRGKPD